MQEYNFLLSESDIDLIDRVAYLIREVEGVNMDRSKVLREMIQAYKSSDFYNHLMAQSDNLE